MVTYEAHVEVTIQMPQKCSHQSQIEHMLWVHFKCVLYVITMKSLGSFNQNSQCSQHVITGSRPPCPQCETSDASGDNQDDQDGGTDNEGIGASAEGSIRVESLMPQEGGLIAEMERQVTEAGAGGWFNRNLEDVLESWSGPNSDTLASQDQVQTTLLTAIGGQTLPNLVRVPDNMMQLAILRSLMEGPI